MAGKGQQCLINWSWEKLFIAPLEHSEGNFWIIAAIGNWTWQWGVLVLKSVYIHGCLISASLWYGMSLGNSLDDSGLLTRPKAFRWHILTHRQRQRYFNYIYTRCWLRYLFYLFVALVSRPKRLSQFPEALLTWVTLLYHIVSLNYQRPSQCPAINHHIRSNQPHFTPMWTPWCK